MTPLDCDHESLLLREPVGAIKPYEVCPGHGATPHEPSGSLSPGGGSSAHA